MLSVVVSSVLCIYRKSNRSAKVEEVENKDTCEIVDGACSKNK